MTLDRLRAALADRYRLERELGQGGMATVYLAADLKHDRKVALKVLKPELAAVLGAERFVVEIKTTAALQHPHILPLFDSGTAEGFLYYVMPVGGGEARQVTSDPAPDFAPAWSRDGSRLVFHSLRSGNRDIYTVDVDGTNLQQRTSSPAEELDASWAPDGSAIVFAVLGSDVAKQGMATLRLAPGAQPEFVALPASDYPCLLYTSDAADD